jgi:hypothetical protein
MVLGMLLIFVEKARLCAKHVNLLEMLAAGERECAALSDHHLVERVVLVLDVDVLAGRRPVAQIADAGECSQMAASRSGWEYGSGRNNRASTTLKTAELAPMPMAREVFGPRGGQESLRIILVDSSNAWESCKSAFSLDPNVDCKRCGPAGLQICSSNPFPSW